MDRLELAPVLTTAPASMVSFLVIADITVQCSTVQQRKYATVQLFWLIVVTVIPGKPRLSTAKMTFFTERFRGIPVH